MNIRNLLPFLFSLLSSMVSAQYFRKIGIKEGLTQPSVLAIYEDSLGRMWFGTREGINIYDGNKIRSFKPDILQKQKPTSRFLVGNEVNQITGDAQGDVFIRTEKSLIKYDIRKETFNLIRSNGVGALTTSEGEIWYTAYDSLFRRTPDTNREIFVHKLKLRDIYCLLIDDRKIWIGTQRGLYLLENGGMQCVLPYTDIYRIFKSSRNEIWISSRLQGLYSIKRDGVLRKEPIAKNKVVSNQIREFAEDERQNIWFGTFEGLQVYNPYSDTYRLIRAENRPGGLSHSSVFSLYKDKKNTIWVGTYYGGVNYFNPSQDIFTYYGADERRDDCLDFPIVGQILEDKERNLWICTDGGGVNCLNRKTGTFTYYTASGTQSIQHNNIKAIAYDEKREQIYIGTHTGGLSRYDCRKKQFHNYPTVKTGNNRPDAIIYALLFHNDRLYVSSRNGVWILNPDTDRFIQLLTNGPYLTFNIDSRGYLWLANRTELLRMNVQKDKMPRCFMPDSTAPECLISNIMESSNGLVYIATLGNGIKTYDYNSGKFASLSKEKNNLLSNYCYNLLETSRNNILITTDKGISIYSPFSRLVQSIEKNDILSTSDGGGLYETIDEQIFIGGTDGMVSFSEKDLYRSSNSMANSNFHFTDLYINNTKVFPGDGTGILTCAMPFTQELRLSPAQNNLSIFFSVSDYASSLRNFKFQYKLEGFDPNWISTTKNDINYTNLPPAHYTLKVRTTGIYPDEYIEKEIKIIIRFPWYNTWWAWLLYAICIACSGYGIYRTKKNRKALTESLKKEKEEKKRIEELNKIKLRFFTNVSHEFRTPLTLIIGQIENLTLSDEFSPSVTKSLRRIHRNAMQLRHLITELLDFRKQEQGFLKMKVEQTDIVNFTNEIYQVFEERAKIRHISYLFEPVEQRIDVWFDPVQMQKAIFNILSNAFKYTPDNGKIGIKISRQKQLIEIAITDSGCGIPEADQARIFDRFYQVGNNESKPGTGIGLALAKEIIDAHKGQIEVTSTAGQGCTFRIYLQTGCNHFTKEELEHEKSGYSIENSDIFASEKEIENLEENTKETETTPADRDKPTILLVEDDKEILEMLEQIFSPTYNVCKASNGQEGFDMASHILPDIILSDVMMPVMSGKELCTKIKNSLELCYIPIVLLTAQNSTEQIIGGYMFGADAYIPKPFHVRLLLARCNSLIKNRRLLMKWQSGKMQDTIQVNEGLNASDRKLIEKATDIVKRNFDNPDFNMDMLADELSLSRTKMFNIFKETLGTTPNDFTLKLKMEEAVRILIDEPQCNISEISYRIGFSSPRYFSRCFKAFYNIPPQDYRKAKANPAQQS